jgi:hypothetical protein
MRKSTSAALAGAAALAFCGAANATTVVETFTGTVASGLDLFGRFGSAGADMTGDAFSMVFTFDPAQGLTQRPNTQVTWDGTGTAILSLNGSSVTLNNIHLGLIHGQQDGIVSDGISANSSTTDGSGRLISNVSFGMQYLPPQNYAPILATPITYNDCAVYLPDCGGQFLDFEASAGKAEFLSLALSSVVITADGPLPDNFFAIPEPSTWAMMVTGLFGLGAALRSRKGGLRRRQLAS